MKTKELTFAYSYTVQIHNNDYVKVAFDKRVELESSDDEDEARELLAADVIDFVHTKMTETLEKLR